MEEIMEDSKHLNLRKEFLSRLFKGGLLLTFLIGTPIGKLLGLTKSPKLYFKENPESVKRQKKREGKYER